MPSPATSNEEKFRPGDRVVRVAGDGRIPEGVKGTVLGRAGYPFGHKWEVEYDGHPCGDEGRTPAYPWAKSRTSWISREEAIELTTEQAMQRVKEAQSA